MSDVCVGTELAIFDDKLIMMEKTHHYRSSEKSINWVQGDSLTLFFSSARLAASFYRFNHFLADMPAIC